ncbi:MAG: hypothetical protein ACKOQS_26330, partial [Dolichospermum sp.]
MGIKVGILQSLGIDKLIERSRHEIFHDENQIIIDIANKARTNLNDIGKHIEKKYSIKKRYQVEISPDLILFDDDGNYPQLRLHYFLTLGNQFVP